MAYFRAWDVPKLRQKQDEKEANTGSGHLAGFSAKCQK